MLEGVFKAKDVVRGAQELLSLCSVPLQPFDYHQWYIPNISAFRFLEDPNKNVNLSKKRYVKAVYHGTTVRCQFLTISSLEEKINCLVHLTLLYNLQNDSMCKFIGVTVKPSDTSPIIIVTEHEETIWQEYVKIEELTWLHRFELIYNLLQFVSYVHQYSAYLIDLSGDDIYIDLEGQLKVSVYFGMLSPLIPATTITSTTPPPPPPPPAKIASPVPVPVPPPPPPSQPPKMNQLIAAQKLNILQTGLMLFTCLTHGQIDCSFDASTSFSSASTVTASAGNSKALLAGYQQCIPLDCPEELEALACWCCEQNLFRRPHAKQCMDEILRIREILFATLPPEEPEPQPEPVVVSQPAVIETVPKQAPPPPPTTQPTPTPPPSPPAAAVVKVTAPVAQPPTAPPLAEATNGSANSRAEERRKSSMKLIDLRFHEREVQEGNSDSALAEQQIPVLQPTNSSLAMIFNHHHNNKDSDDEDEDMFQEVPVRFEEPPVVVSSTTVAGKEEPIVAISTGKDNNNQEEDKKTTEEDNAHQEEAKEREKEEAAEAAAKKAAEEEAAEAEAEAASNLSLSLAAANTAVHRRRSTAIVSGGGMMAAAPVSKTMIIPSLPPRAPPALGSALPATTGQQSSQRQRPSVLPMPRQSLLSIQPVLPQSSTSTPQTHTQLLPMQQPMVLQQQTSALTPPQPTSSSRASIRMSAYIPRTDTSNLTTSDEVPLPFLSLNGQLLAMEYELSRHIQDLAANPFTASEWQQYHQHEAVYRKVISSIHQTMGRIRLQVKTLSKASLIDFHDDDHIEQTIASPVVPSVTKSSAQVVVAPPPLSSTSPGAVKVTSRSKKPALSIIEERTSQQDCEEEENDQPFVNHSVSFIQKTIEEDHARRRSPSHTRGGGSRGSESKALKVYTEDEAGEAIGEEEAPAVEELCSDEVDSDDEYATPPQQATNVTKTSSSTSPSSPQRQQQSGTSSRTPSPNGRKKPARLGSVIIPGRDDGKLSVAAPPLIPTKTAAAVVSTPTNATSQYRPFSSNSNHDNDSDEESVHNIDLNSSMSNIMKGQNTPTPTKQEQHQQQQRKHWRGSQSQEQSPQQQSQQQQMYVPPTTTYTATTSNNNNNNNRPMSATHYGNNSNVVAPTMQTEYPAINSIHSFLHHIRRLDEVYAKNAELITPQQVQSQQMNALSQEAFSTAYHVLNQSPPGNNKRGPFSNSKSSPRKNNSSSNSRGRSVSPARRLNAMHYANTLPPKLSKPSTAAIDGNHPQQQLAHSLQPLTSPQGGNNNDQNSEVLNQALKAYLNLVQKCSGTSERARQLMDDLDQRNVEDIPVIQPSTPPSYYTDQNNNNYSMENSNYTSNNNSYASGSYTTAAGRAYNNTSTSAATTAINLRRAISPTSTISGNSHGHGYGGGSGGWNSNAIYGNELDLKREAIPSYIKPPSPGANNISMNSPVGGNTAPGGGSGSGNGPRFHQNTLSSKSKRASTFRLYNNTSPSKQGR